MNALLIAFTGKGHAAQSHSTTPTDNAAELQLQHTFGSWNEPDKESREQSTKECHGEPSLIQSSARGGHKLPLKLHLRYQVGAEGE
jgi:hypothetical protein